MTRIPGQGQKPPIETSEQPADLRTKEGVQQFREATSKEVPKTVVDSFERAAPQLETKLQALAQKTTVGNKISFTNQDLAEIAKTFAATLKQTPNAARKARAGMFARALLFGGKGSRFRKIFDGAKEADLEEMFGIIADQLDKSPVFAQLVDEVTEGARKLAL